MSNLSPPLKVAEVALPSVRQTLPRVIGYVGGTAIIVGTIIGSGIFLIPHDVAQQVGSVRTMFLVWIVGGILSLAGALSLAELSTSLPEAGGVYVYLREAYGRRFAFLYGWALLLVINSGAIAVLAVAFSIYASTIAPLTPLQQKLLSAVLIAILTAVNIVGTRGGAAVQTLFTFAKLAGLGFIVACAYLLRPMTSPSVASSLPTPQTTLSSFGIALVGVLWTYEGWHMLGFNAEEVKEPARVLPVSFAMGTLLTVIVYLIANLAYLRVLSLPVLAQNQRVASKAMELLLGPAGATFVSVLILCSIFGALNGNVLGGPRTYFAMARDKLFFPSVAHVHERFQTPARAILIQGVWAAVLAASGTYKQLYTYVIFTAWFFYGAAVIGVIVLRRRRPELVRPYRVWGYPVLPVVFALSAAAIGVNTLIRSPRESLIGLGLVLAGIPIYLLWRPRSEPNASTGETLVQRENK